MSKLFEKIAVKQLKVNKFNRLCDSRLKKFYERKGWLTKLPNGNGILDLDKVRAHNSKVNVMFTFIGIPAAMIIGNVLGNINSRK